VDVGRWVEPTAVPLVRAVVCHCVVMAEQVPAVQVCVECLLIILENGDVDVAMITCLPAQQQVDRPATADVPTLSVSNHVVSGKSQRLRKGSLSRRRALIHEQRLSPSRGGLQGANKAA
jgi:hypothetical protein